MNRVFDEFDILLGEVLQGVLRTGIRILPDRPLALSGDDEDVALLVGAAVIRCSSNFRIMINGRADHGLRRLRAGQG
ncbi:hypothetical protein GCM10009813_29730 [Brevibacterium marinum]